MKPPPLPLCACGLPLHYSDLTLMEAVIMLSPDDTVEITAPQGRFRVQRHYIALHGIAAEELNELAARGVIERIR